MNTHYLTKKCIYCGTMNYEDAERCRGCGKSFNDYYNEDVIMGC